jgi:hypothetical protein
MTTMTTPSSLVLLPNLETAWRNVDRQAAVNGIKNRVSPAPRAAEACRICPSVSGPINRAFLGTYVAQASCFWISALLCNVCRTRDALRFDRLV